MTVRYNDFHYFIHISDNWPSRTWWIFYTKITRIESMKPKLLVIGCYSITAISNRTNQGNLKDKVCL
uniref:Uncharacterized protein n=1 Tax=Lepeophtheirus salmonis TaxID=72036 RepID=A0A0K2ULA2_LEPSM